MQECAAWQKGRFVHADLHGTAPQVADDLLIGGGSKVFIHFPQQLLTTPPHTGSFSNGVNVYVYPGTSYADATDTELQANLHARGAWGEQALLSQLVVRVLTTNGSYAQVCGRFRER